MGAVKIKPADSAFSKCIRERANWTCERCGSVTPDDKRMGLHCSPFHGRGKWATRFDSDNCEAICYGCHAHLGASPHLHEQRQREKLGDGLYQIVLERSQDTSLGRLAKRTQKDIAKHYRGELKRMEALRAAGESGRIEFESWC